MKLGESWGERSVDYTIKEVNPNSNYSTEQEGQKNVDAGDLTWRDPPVQKQAPIVQQASQFQKTPSKKHQPIQSHKTSNNKHFEVPKIARIELSKPSIPPQTLTDEDRDLVQYCKKVGKNIHELGRLVERDQIDLIGLKVERGNAYSEGSFGEDEVGFVLLVGDCSCVQGRRFG